MNNQVLKINGINTLVHRSSRKIIWFQLPELRPIHRYYTKSTFFNIDSEGNIMIADEGTITFITIQLPPLSLCLYQKQFIEYNPTGGFSFGNTVVLYEKHSICFFNKFPSFTKTYIIEVVQSIENVRPSPEGLVLGVMVKQKKNIIFIWDLGELSNKPKQEIQITDEIVKWQFYLKQMLIIMTKTHLRVYYPQDGHYNIQFYIEIPNNSIDFCMLDRPKTNEHTGRRTVYPVSILSANARLFIYELYDIDKRIKVSLANIISNFEVDQSIIRIITGYEKSNNQAVFIFQNNKNKPISMTTNQKFELFKQQHYNRQISDKIKSIRYENGYSLIQEDHTEQQNQAWKLFRNYGQNQFELVSGFIGLKAILAKKRLYLFNESTLTYYNKSNNFSVTENTIQFKAPVHIELLEEDENHCYFICGIKIYRLDHGESQIKAIGFSVRNQKFKLQEVRTHTKSLLYKAQDQYYLMEYKVENLKVITKNIHSSSNKIISLRKGRWVEMSNLYFCVGQGDRKLATFQLMKFFKSISSQNNSLYEYQLFWTTHDGIIMLVKNYIFVFQLIEGAECYTLTPLKKMLTYIHHRFNPDVQNLEVLDSRNFVIREGNRVIKLGSKLGYFVSEDPYTLPDTLLHRQLAMRKQYPPHHPKIIRYLIQLGSFSQITKLVRNLYKWIESQNDIKSLYQMLDAQFFNQYNEEDDERIIVSKLDEDELSDIQKMNKLCERILEDPSKLRLQENGGLILQSQIQALVYKEENSRSLDYFSSIIITQQHIDATINKTRAFQTMDIAYMIHSINKDEALSILKPQKLDWSWFKKYSVIMWYDNKQQIRKWVEEIGGSQYRKQKQPFDCLLWYTIAGKKNILTTLFKNHKFNSKEHAGVLAFLQRDFSDPKTLAAAIKNAYALHDKKRYYHSLAFFILGQKYEEAINMSLNKLRDINMAMMLCRVFNYPPDRIYSILMEQGDIWIKHIVYFYQAKHIESFNILFSQENYGMMDKWDIELKLTKFHPCLKHFAEMIEKSIPVKRQLQEQRLKKQQSQNQSMDIFQSFYGNEANDNSMQQSNFQEKVLTPNYQSISELSVQFFLQDQCPELALMIDHHNYKAQRAYDLSRFMISRRITPAVLEIAEQMQDTQSIILSKLESKHSVFDAIREHYIKAVESYKELAIDELVPNQKHVIGKAMHFCYLSNKILEREKYLLQREESSECMIFIEQKVKSSVLIGKLLLTLELKQFNLVGRVIEEIFNFHHTKIYENADKQFWDAVKLAYDRLPHIKKNKSLQVIDQFEQSFYKYTFAKSQAEYFNTNFKLDTSQSCGIYLKRFFLEMVIPYISRQWELHNHLTKMVKKLDKLFTVWLQNDSILTLNNEMELMISEKGASKMQISYFPEYLEDNFDSIVHTISTINQKQKHPNFSYVKYSSNFKQPNYQLQEAIQIFKNKSEKLSSFTINKNEGSGMELGLLFKRGVKKIEICQSLINRNRTKDGLYLVHEDFAYTIDHSIDFDILFDKKYPPLIEETLHNIISNRNQYNGKGIFKGSTKRGQPEYLKPSDSRLHIDYSQIFTIKCHHFLPVYLLGGKGQIELCEFNQLQNYNRIKCPGMSDIVKLSSFEQRITALDSSGNLSTYSFDPKITGNTVFNIKKAGITDFCILSPTIYAYSTTNSLQVVDSLLHPKRQCVFKLNMSQQPQCIESLLESKIVVCRKTDLQIYDIRMDIQESTRDIALNNSNNTSSTNTTRPKCICSNHKNKVLVGRNDGRVRVVDYNDKDKDYQVKCSRGLDENKETKGLSIEEIEIMGNSAVMRNNEGSIFLIDKIE